MFPLASARGQAVGVVGERNPADEAWEARGYPRTSGIRVQYAYRPTFVPAPTVPPQVRPSLLSHVMERIYYGIFGREQGWAKLPRQRFLDYPSFYTADEPYTGPQGNVARQTARPRYREALPYEEDAYTPPTRMIRGGRGSAWGRWVEPTQPGAPDA